MQFKLFPKQDDFYTLFDAQVALVVEASNLFHSIFENWAERAAIVDKIVSVEDQGDRQTRRIIEHVNKSFITPVDREDIHRLAVFMDDVLDLIQSAAVRLRLNEIDEPLPAAAQMANLLTRCADVLHQGVQRLPKLESVDELFEKMQEYENEGDALNRRAIADLYKSCREVSDIVLALKWKDVMERLEDSVDRFKHMFELLQEVMIKHG